MGVWVLGRGGLGGADGGLVVRFGRVVWVVGLLCCLAVLGGAAADAAGAATLYAYAGGAGTPAGCPQAPSGAGGCSLSRALSVAAAGDTVELASAGASTGGSNYVGNWTVSTAGTSAQAPVTIDGSGVSDATLDGNHGNASGCSTDACNGPVLTVGAGMFVVLEEPDDPERRQHEQREGRRRAERCRGDGDDHRFDVREQQCARWRGGR